MRINIELNEAELATAVKEYLLTRGMDATRPVVFKHSGFPESPDPRERCVTYSAMVEGEMSLAGSESVGVLVTQ